MGIYVKDLKHFATTVLQCELENDGDHVRYTLRVNSKDIATFKYSRSWRGNFQIPEFILHKQAQSMHCPLQMWKALIQERVSKEVYFSALLKQELIDQVDFETLCKR